jgi:uncharacterized membrane protein YeaQ/YmgE (transglycosylase-associated protein family)
VSEVLGTYGWLAVIVVGLVVGWLVGAYAIPNREYPAGWIGYLLAGLVGGVGGGWIPGNWGWTLDHANMVASIVLAAVVTYVVGLFGKAKVSG